jgi:ABC-type multidrug transport system fused ATPase/permease subunit
MSRILKSIAPYWKSVIIILILLILQANGDLALPQYTSDIIDVGIQNGGIGHSIPEKITKDEYEIAKMFMTDEEIYGKAVMNRMAIFTSLQKRMKKSLMNMMIHWRWHLLSIIRCHQ